MSDDAPKHRALFARVADPDLRRDLETSFDAYQRRTGNGWHADRERADRAERERDDARQAVGLQRERAEKALERVRVLTDAALDGTTAPADLIRTACARCTAALPEADRQRVVVMHGRGEACPRLPAAVEGAPTDCPVCIEDGVDPCQCSALPLALELEFARVEGARDMQRQAVLHTLAQFGACPDAVMGDGVRAWNEATRTAADAIRALGPSRKP